MLIERATAQRNRGFTLVEVMVAMAIIAVALPALMFGLMAQLDGTAYARDKSIANWVALNQMAELRLKNRASGKALIKSEAGKVEMANRQWYWYARSEKLPELEQLSDEIPKDLYSVEISVKLKDDKNAQSLVMLKGVFQELPEIRPVPGALPPVNSQDG